MAESHGVFLPAGSKTYHCRVMVDRKRHSTSTGCTSKRDAMGFSRRWKVSLIAQAKAARAAAPQMTMLQGVNRYMKEAGEKLVAADQVEVFFDWLVDRIGAATPLADIRNDTVSRLMAERGEDFRYGNPDCGPVADTYVERAVLIPLRVLLRRAVEAWDIELPNEPTWSRHKVKKRFRTRVMSWDEEMAIKAVVSPDFWALIEFVLLTGLRREDALIEWEQVDRIARVIRLIIKGNRPFEVRITAGIRKLLEEAEAIGGQRPEVWTYVPKSGPDVGIRKNVSYGMFQSLWRAACKRAGVKGLRIHDLRRTAGERLYRATGDIYVVSRFLGHSSVELTRMYYLHVQPDDIEERQLAMEWVRAKSLDEHARMSAA